jgi:hypothetical protein
MQVVSPGAIQQAPTVNRHLPASASALPGVLHAVLNAPVDSSLAPALAIAVGGAAGAGVSLLCNGSSRLFGDALIGSALGVISHSFARGRHREDAAHGRRWDVLNQTPKLRAWLQKHDIRFVDRERVAYMHGAMQGLVQGTVDHYRGYCADHAMVCDPQAVDAIVRFCWRECVDRGPFLALQPNTGFFYLAAIEDHAADALNRELRAGEAASVAFRRRGYVFMRWELVPVTHRAGAPAQQDRPASPVCHLLPAPDPASTALAECYRPSVDSVVIIRHRRTSNLRVDTARRPQRWWEN